MLEFRIELADEATACNFIEENITKITIFLNDRKNASFKRIVKQLNDDFLLEFICSLTGIDGKGLCGGFGGAGACLCPIKGVVAIMGLKNVE